MKLVLPLRQHVGAPGTPVVQVGDEVKRGQLIAKPAGLGANIHASANGKIVEINENEIAIEAVSEINMDDYVRLHQKITCHL